MKQARFVNLLSRVVVDRVVEDAIIDLAAPSGRRISEEQQRRAAWFNSFSAEDRANINYVAQGVARGVAFGFFCVVGGCRVIKNYDHRGDLELPHIYNETKTLLSSSADDSPVEALHELL